MTGTMRFAGIANCGLTSRYGSTRMITSAKVVIATIPDDQWDTASYIKDKRDGVHSSHRPLHTLNHPNPNHKPQTTNTMFNVVRNTAARSTRSALYAPMRTYATPPSSNSQTQQTKEDGANAVGEGMKKVGKALQVRLLFSSWYVSGSLIFRATDQSERTSTRTELSDPRPRPLVVHSPATVPLVNSESCFCLDEPSTASSVVG